MAPGRPFADGVDPRRNLRGRPPSKPSPTARTLTREEREATVNRLKALRDQAEDLDLALEACKLLLAYSDGEPGEKNVPDEADASGQTVDAEVLRLLQPPALAETTIAAPPLEGATTTTEDDSGND